MKLNISWFGRCCFLTEIDNKKILFDPYDRFANVDIGIIESDIMLISSTWHDHGHIGSSPGSHIYSYSGEYENGEVKITGIEAKEDRGTPTIVFNIQYKGFSITNFADFGPMEEAYFESVLTDKQREILKTTNIAFIRPMIEGREVTGNNVHNENALKYCSPNIIFPEHYFPRSFIKDQVPEEDQERYSKPVVIVDEMAEAIGYIEEKIDDYKLEISKEDLKNMKVFKRFMKLHPQVKYIESNWRKSW